MNNRRWRAVQSMPPPDQKYPSDLPAPLPRVPSFSPSRNTLPSRRIPSTKNMLPPEEITRQKNRALIELCKLGETEQAEEQIRSGAEINATGEEGLNAIQWACRKGHFSTVEMLVKCGADTTLKTRNLSPCDIAVLNGHTQIADFLKMVIGPPAPVHNRISGRYSVDRIPEDPLEPNNFSKKTQPKIPISDIGLVNRQLLIAVSCGDLGGVAQALRRGADIDIVSTGLNEEIYGNIPDGMTPLMLAIQVQFPDVVRFLLKNNANTDYRNPAGMNAKTICESFFKKTIPPSLFSDKQYVEQNFRKPIEIAQLLICYDIPVDYFF